MTAEERAKFAWDAWGARQDFGFGREVAQYLAEEELEELLGFIAQQIDESILAEREACAKIAEATLDCCDCQSVNEVLMSKYHDFESKAAKAIRARSHETVSSS